MATNKDKKHCAGKCKKEQKIGDFYASSDTSLFPDGRLHICKTCIKEMINLDDMDTLHKVLQMINKPFLYDVWASSLENKQDTVGVYIRTLNGRQHKHKTWKDSVFASSESKSHQLQEHSSQPSKLDENKISFWGFGYTDEEYKEFERKYHRLKKNYKEKTEMHTESLKTYVRYRVREEFATARGDSKEAKAWGELAAKAATDAKLNPNQMSKSDVSDGVDVMSQLAEIVESYVGVIPIMPRILEQPYDDADMIIWSVVNYSRKLDEKPRVSYRDIYQFYDKMIDDYCKDKNMTPHEIEEYKQKRNNTFRDMELAFQEPLYESTDEEVFDNE